MKARPPLEEVKEYFKNAKEVQSPNESDIVDITISIIKDIHEWNNEYWIDLDKNHYDGQSVLLWDRIKGYAKIISYKDETYQITEEQIKQLYKNAVDNNLQLTTFDLPKWFPSVFKEDKKEFVAGKWYKSLSEYGSLFQYLGKMKVLGFFKGHDWTNPWQWSRDIPVREATPQEIKQALENEARKRYEVGDKIIDSIGRKAVFTGKIIYHEGNENNGISNGNNMWIMRNGIWATIIQPKQMTKQQIEKELGYDIYII